MEFENFLYEFSGGTTALRDFLINALLAALLSFLLGLFYMRFGQALTNRKRFGSIFMFLTLSTMLIIFIVKSSIALSLGLVGALSIVRFRAAIKEPEELVYLFFAIGIGLGLGANQRGVTLLAYLLIISLLTLQHLFQKRGGLRNPEGMYLNISTSSLPVQSINQVLADHFRRIELKRLDQAAGRTDLVYLIEGSEVDGLLKAKDQLLEQDPQLQFSFLEQRSLPL